MCDKGTWIDQAMTGQQIQGFFRLTRGDRAFPASLTDASGCLPIANDCAVQVRGLINKVVWASGMAETHDHAVTVRLASALPAICWTGNPFALANPESPGYPVAGRLYNHVQNIRDQELTKLIEEFFSDTSLFKGFMIAPASIRHHHSNPGGLAIHTCETMEVADRMAALLSEQDHALVMTACLLHDAGKVFEYQCGGRWLSPRGRLLGHEITLLEILAPIADRIWSLGDPKRMMLLHLLTAKPAPQWTGIRHPRTRLVSIVRFADRWSVEGDIKGRNASEQPISSIATGIASFRGHGSHCQR